MQTFDRLESEVRSSWRHFPRVFAKASGSRLVDEDGREYVDFVAGGGTLNYGHNDPVLERHLTRYLERDGLGMAANQTRGFVHAFDEVILSYLAEDLADLE